MNFKASSSNETVAREQPVDLNMAVFSPAFPAPAAFTAWPLGAAFADSEDLPGRRIYLCDPETHTINVLDQNHQPIFSFGGFGSGPGQFNSPTDVAVVSLDAGAPAGSPPDSAVLAVADRGNHRVQLFEMDGSSVCVIGGRADGALSGGWPARAGWPFFRLGCAPSLPFPSRLEWRSPYLDVVCMGNVMVRVDLSVELLPDFGSWIRDAKLDVLQQAFRRFTTEPNRAEIPAWCLFGIVERLQSAMRGASASAWLGRW